MNPELLSLVVRPPQILVLSNGTSTAVAIVEGSFADKARSRFDLIAFIDDLGSVIVGRGGEEVLVGVVASMDCRSDVFSVFFRSSHTTRR